MEHARKLNGAGTNSGGKYGGGTNGGGNHGGGTNVVCGDGSNIRMKFVGINHVE